jgi:hypothetical protein
MQISFVPETQNFTPVDLVKARSIYQDIFDNIRASKYVFDRKTFKVLIAGGGIAGLILAHMLEKFHIDYLLLESHGEIDPTIGASIGILPNGARILDQLDLYEPIAELDYKDKRGNHIHKENGDCLLNIARFHNHIEHRYLSYIGEWFIVCPHADSSKLDMDIRLYLSTVNGSFVCSMTGCETRTACF